MVHRRVAVAQPVRGGEGVATEKEVGMKALTFYGAALVLALLAILACGRCWQQIQQADREPVVAALFGR